MLVILNSMFAITTAVLQRHVIVDCSLHLGHALLKQGTD